MKRPVVLGLTLGDPAGIGPEIAVKAALGRRWPGSLRLVLIGSAALIRAECRRQRLPFPPIRGDGIELPPVSLWDPTPGPAAAVPPGRCSARGARQAVAWIEAAVRACQSGELDGLVTGPVNKEGLKRAGVPFPGHRSPEAPCREARPEMVARKIRGKSKGVRRTPLRRTQMQATSRAKRTANSRGL